jgi:hypothetical protein
MSIWSHCLKPYPTDGSDRVGGNPRRSRFQRPNRRRTPIRRASPPIAAPSKGCQSGKAVRPRWARCRRGDDAQADFPGLSLRRGELAQKPRSMDESLPRLQAGRPPTTRTVESKRRTDGTSFKKHHDNSNLSLMHLLNKSKLIVFTQLLSRLAWTFRQDKSARLDPSRRLVEK